METCATLAYEMGMVATTLTPRAASPDENPGWWKAARCFSELCLWFALLTLGCACSCSADPSTHTHDAATSDGSDASDSAVPTECDLRVDALSDACVIDEDCALVVHTRCLQENGEGSRALGIARAALPAFNELAVDCNFPTWHNEAGQCLDDGFGTIAPSHVEGETSFTAYGFPMAVRCDAGRCVSYRSWCGPTSCGNATIDDCSLLESEDGLVFTEPLDGGSRTEREDCDGETLGDQTCQALGFGGGTLACVPEACFFDTSTCRPCVDTDGTSSTCINDVFDTTSVVEAYAFATSDTEIAIVSARVDGNERLLELARFDADLALLGRSNMPLDLDVVEVGVGRGTNGWIVNATVSDWTTGTNQPHTDLHTFDSDGNYQGRAQRIENASGSRLVATPGMPLLVYNDLGGNAHTVALSTDLSNATESIRIGPGWIRSAVFVGDGFLLALGDTVRPSFALQRVEIDGSVIAPRISVSPGADLPRLAVNDLGPWLMFAFHAESTIVMRLMNSGERVADSNDSTVPIAPDAEATMVGLGDSMLVAWGRPGDDSTESVVATLNSEGTLSAPTLLVRYPSVGATTLIAHADHAVLAAHGSLPGVPTIATERYRSLSLARINR